MQLTTIRNKPKSFSWSFSRLKNFETCGKRYFHIDVEKSVREEESEVLKWGNSVHKALAEYVENSTALPRGMEPYQRVADKIKSANGDVYVEQKYALTRDFAPCGFFDSSAWFRGIADVVVINGPVALAVDYKLGKIIEESQQLALVAACVFAHHPSVQKVRTEFWWLKEDATTRADFARSDMPNVWKNILPRVGSLEIAHDTHTFPPKPGGLCRKWCPVRACPHHGT
jgi:RecB family exonuclease